jgi:hypothetical protein
VMTRPDISDAISTELWPVWQRIRIGSVQAPLRVLDLPVSSRVAESVEGKHY